MNDEQDLERRANHSSIDYDSTLCTCVPEGETCRYCMTFEEPIDIEDFMIEEEF